MTFHLAQAEVSHVWDQIACLTKLLKVSRNVRRRSSSSDSLLPGSGMCAATAAFYLTVAVSFFVANARSAS